MLLLMALAVAFFLFWTLRGLDLHWAVCLLAATGPVVLTFFLGLIGLVASAVVTLAVYRATC